MNLSTRITMECKRFRNPANFCRLWNPESWSLKSGIQLKESGISLSIGIQDPSSSDKESEIHGVESTSKKVPVLDSLQRAKSRFHLVIVVDKGDFNCFIPLPSPSHSLQNAILVF